MATAKSMTKAKAVTEEIIQEETIVEKRVFQPEDLISCKSNCNGELLIVGQKSGYMYTWPDYGCIEEVEYRDLFNMVRTPGNLAINEPRLIVLDQDFIEQNPKLNEIYEKLNNVDDLTEIFSYTAKQMKETIEKMPDKLKETVKNLAGTMIDQHKLDSVQKIKVLDEIFGTQLLLTLAEH